MTTSYADLRQFFRERWEIARDACSVYPDPQYKAEEAVYGFLVSSFGLLVDLDVPWDDLHTRWAIADALLEAVVNLVPESFYEVVE